MLETTMTQTALADLPALGRALETAWRVETSALASCPDSHSPQALAAIGATEAIVERIAALQARTVADLQSKALAYLWTQGGDPTGETTALAEGDTTEGRILASLLRDLLRPAPDGAEDAAEPGLVIACRTARAAVAAYDAEAGKDEPGDLSALFDRERLALECVAATRARTPRGIAEKALLLDECAESVETVGLALSLADDAVALVKGMIGIGPARA